MESDESILEQLENENQIIDIYRLYYGDDNRRRIIVSFNTKTHIYTMSVAKARMHPYRVFEYCVWNEAFKVKFPPQNIERLQVDEMTKSVLSMFEEMNWSHPVINDWLFAGTLK